jgi:hypothetical protein
LRIQIVEGEDGILFARSWPGERGSHDPICEAVGDRFADNGSSIPSNTDSFHLACERAMDEAYGLQFFSGCGPRWMARQVAYELEKLLPRTSLMGSNLGVGFVQNEEMDRVIDPNLLPVETYPNIEGSEWTNWPVHDDISVSLRTDPFGQTLKARHLVVGIWKPDSPLSHLHLWPVVEYAQKIHPVHSGFEGKVAGVLSALGGSVVKVVSQEFLESWPGEAQTLRTRLVEAGFLPDFIYFDPAGMPIVVEAAGLHTAQYLIRLQRKATTFRAWEKEWGLQWMIVKPERNGLRISHRSKVLSIGDQLEKSTSLKVTQ